MLFNRISKLIFIKKKLHVNWLLKFFLLIFIFKLSLKKMLLKKHWHFEIFHCLFFKEEYFYFFLKKDHNKNNLVICFKGEHIAEGTTINWLVNCWTITVKSPLCLPLPLLSSIIWTDLVQRYITVSTRETTAKPAIVWTVLTKATRWLGKLWLIVNWIMLQNYHHFKVLFYIFKYAIF